MLQHLPLPLRGCFSQKGLRTRYSLPTTLTLDAVRAHRLFSDVREYEVLETEYAPDGSRIYQPHIIDIDILLYGDRTVDTPTLKIPNPQIGERDYAKRLLRQIL